jgi:hypothetical protein
MRTLGTTTAISAIAIGAVTAALAAASAAILSPPPATSAQSIVVVTGPSANTTFTSQDAAPRATTVANAGQSVGSSDAVTSEANIPYLAPFNNGKPANGATWFGASVGDGKYSGTGWPKTSDMQGMVDLGVKTVRLPFAPKYCLNPDGTLNNWVINTLAADVRFNMSRGVSTVLDAHTYLPFTDSTVSRFWSLFAPAMETAIGGATPFFGIELANEPGKSNRDLTLWTEPLRKTIKDIRSAGYKGYIFAGAGDWNNMTFLRTALVEVERTGGVTKMDPLNRTIYTGHDYWNKDADLSKTRNDLGSAVDGRINIAQRYDPSLLVARRIGAKIVMSEIGGGISPTGPLPAFGGVGKNGKQIQEEYFIYAKANQDALIGTWFWMAGKTPAGYRHKIEAGNPHTVSLQKFW